MSDGGFQPRRARAALTICGGAHFLHDGFSDALYVLMPLWAQSFGLSMAQVGLLKLVYSGAMASFQVPAGILSERFGERALLAAGTVVTGIGYVLLGSAGGFATLIVFLLVAGLGSGVQHPLSSAVVARAYENGPRRAALGIYNFTGDLGKVAVPAVIALGAGAIGWRSSTMAYGALGIAAGFVILLALRRLAEGGPIPVSAHTPSGGPQRRWGIRNRRGFMALSSIGMVDSAVRYGFLTFLPFHLIDQGAGVEMVGLALTLTFGGGAAGKLVCGLVAERFGVIRTAVLTEFVTGAGILAVLALPLGGILALLPVVGVALHGTSSVLYGTVAEFVETERQSRAFGLFYTLGIGAGALSPAIFGVIGDAAGVPVAIALLAGCAFLTLPLCYALRTSMAAPGGEAA